MAHGIFRSDNMEGTVNGAYLASAQYKPSGTATAIDNGNFVVLGAYATGEREVQVATTPAANSDINALAVVATDEVDTAKTYTTLADFTNEAGAVLKCYKLHKQDIFSLSADAVYIASGTPAVGWVLEAQAGTKGSLVSSLTASSTQIATLVAIETQGTTTWYVFRV